MAVEVQFLEDGHIIYQKLVSPWSLTEMNDLHAEEKPHFDKFPYKVHTLVNALESKVLPSGALGARLNSPSIFHPNRGKLVIVGASQFVRSMCQAVFRITNFRDVDFFEREEDAFVYLRRLIAEEKAAKA